MDPSLFETFHSLAKYVDHEYNCDWRQVQWNKGPCDCGLHARMSKMTSGELTLLEQINPEVVASYRRWQSEKAEAGAALRSIEAT